MYSDPTDALTPFEKNAAPDCGEFRSKPIKHRPNLPPR